MSRHLLSDKHRLDTAQLAAIYERHKHEPDSDVMRLWLEVDALRFENTAAHERTAIAREERKSLEDQLWLVRLQLPRGPGPV